MAVQINGTGLITYGSDQIGVPPGVYFPFAGSTAPNGYLLCQGQAVSRTTYADLFTAISTTYGVGDGSTTFNLPDARGRTIFGKDNMGGSAANRLTTAGGGVDGLTLGAAGGGETVTLTTTTMPSHTHVQNAHSHTVPSGSAPGTAISSINGGNAINTSTSSVTATNQNNGSSGAHANVPPAIVGNIIIKY